MGIVTEGKFASGYSNDNNNKYNTIYDLVRIVLVGSNGIIPKNFRDVEEDTVLFDLMNKAWNEHKGKFDCKGEELIKVLNKVTINGTVLKDTKLNMLSLKIEEIYDKFRILEPFLVVNTYLKCRRK